jgi:hypothetical protein
MGDGATYRYSVHPGRTSASVLSLTRCIQDLGLGGSGLAQSQTAGDLVLGFPKA